MGALSAGGLVGSLSTAATVLKTLDSTFKAVQGFSGASDSDQRAALRAQQDMALRQLQQKQNIEELSAAEQAALERRNIAASAASAYDERRTALKRAVARQRAQFGAQGLGSDDGSGEAVLLGMFDESEHDKAERDQLDHLRYQALESDLSDQKRVNVLQRTQLKEKQNLERLLGGY